MIPVAQTVTGASPDAGAITGIVLAAAAMITALTPLVMRYRARWAVRSVDTRVSWESITHAMQTELDRTKAERDRLQDRLDESERRCNERLALADQERQAQDAAYRTRIKALEEEVASLRRVIAELRRA